MLDIKWIVKGKGFRTKALGSMPQILCYPNTKEKVKAMATKLVSVTLNGNVKNNPPYSPLTKGGHRWVRSDKTGLVTEAVRLIRKT